MFKFKYNKSMLFFLLNLLFFNITEVSAVLKTVVLIDEVVKEFLPNTSCSVDLWANKFTNSCKCCLIKHAPELGLGKNPKEVLSICTNPNRKRCDNNVIHNLEKENNLDNIKTEDEKLKKLIETLYQKSVLVKEVHPHNVTFNNNGHFTEQSAAEFLAQAYKDHRLSNADFKSANCLKVKNIMTQKGFQTVQLFTITSTCGSKTSEYILKEMSAGIGEIIKLENSFIVKALEPYIYPKQLPNFPSFIFPVAYISYVYNNKAHYLSLLDKSPGIILLDVIKGYKENKINTEEAKNIYYQVGFNLSYFHKEMMQYFKDKANPNILLNHTYIQGDCHQGNVFYDKDNKQTIFIDNENISKLSPADPFYDIAYFFFVTYNLFIPDNIKSDANFMNKWLTLAMENFLSGYIDAYPQSLRKQLTKELAQKLKSDSSYPYHARSAYSKHKQVIDNVVKQLENKYNK